MRLQFGKFFIQFGHPRGDNLVDLSEAESHGSRIVIRLAQETLDSTLTFSIELLHVLNRGGASACVELHGWNIDRLLQTIHSRKPLPPYQLRAKNQAIYKNFPVALIGDLLNEVWLSCDIRISARGSNCQSGQGGVTSSRHGELPDEMEFVFEKNSLNGSDQITIRSRRACTDLAVVVRDVSTGLRYPLIETRLVKKPIP